MKQLRASSWKCNSQQRWWAVWTKKETFNAILLVCLFQPFARCELRSILCHLKWTVSSTSAVATYHIYLFSNHTLSCAAVSHTTVLLFCVSFTTCSKLLRRYSKLLRWLSSVDTFDYVSFANSTYVNVVSSLNLCRFATSAVKCSPTVNISETMADRFLMNLKGLFCGSDCYGQKGF